jgi:deoxyhypusine synthase
MFLGYTSNLISSVLRGVFWYLVEPNHVSAVVTTGGGIEEDLIKCIRNTFISSFNMVSASLRKKK